MRRLTRTVVVGTLLALSGLLLSADLSAQRGRGAPAPAARASAPFDLTGYWVSLVTEDWRLRMLTPARGDYPRVPMTPDARQIADAWDPAADERAGLACKGYGAAAIMRMPGRLHITWEDGDTLRVDTDAGMQSRRFRFDAPPAPAGEPTWQGYSVAEWVQPQRGRGAGAPEGDAAGGSLTVVTSHLRPGYLRKNGVPYSGQTVVTEYFDLAPLPDGGWVLLVTTVVEDPQYLRQPLIVSSQFKKEADGSKWDPTPCSAT